ncbi:MAG TPA: hypothetical protein VM076_07530 [Gemmatimonadaceae bacterium]|nr:hypothetical protein [Gemmatimonadaceae bacterium]
MPAAKFIAYLALGGVMGAAACSTSEPAPVAETTVVYSDAFTIDTTWASMQGPYRVMKVQLTDSTSHELVWVTGYEAAIVDADSREAKSPEFMCHSNVDVDMARHRQIFGWQKYPSRRLFTLSEGQTDVRLPDGFGIPLRSDEPLSVTAQVLNHNYHGAPVRVRQRITVHYVRDRALRKPLVPLYQRGINTLVRLDGPGGGFNTEVDEHAMHEHGGAEGMSADTLPYKDREGRTFAGHWVVKPGREERRTPINGWLQMSQDLKIHYVSVHLHPFAESLQLRDVTTGQTVLASKAENRAERIGLARADQIASREGITLHKDHQYELVSEYNNTSGADRTAMAVMYLYLEDTEFRRK